MFTFIVIILWIIIIGTLIGGIIHAIRGVPGFLRESRLKYEEEKWRQEKEKEFLKRIEWEKQNPRIYEMRKENNPYKKNIYYLSQPKYREYWLEHSNYNDYEFYATKYEYNNPAQKSTISLSEFFFHNETFLDPFFKIIILIISILFIPVLLILSPLIIFAKIYQYFRERYLDKFYPAK
ncbi:hypothetical protein [Anaerovibrio sp. RM50]|uniref:hypothetical protein n=1 Tax=Anaerovibrio sp. RM50 TaxID=1200557 RepID=UPI000483C9BB|nr:hypothetical protein [Anaerovibrio sp. RM50]